MAELGNLGGVGGSEGLFSSTLTAPSSEFLLVDEESSSTYPLLTPSPLAEFNHPLALDTPPGKNTPKVYKKWWCLQYC